MPLYVPPAPAPALRSVLAALGSPTAVREAPTPSLRALTDPPTPELPLPVHVLDRLTGDGPFRTRLTGWRFLIRGNDRAVAAADSMLTPDGWTFSHFFEGPYLSSTERALRQAESLPADWQPRLLSIPALYMLTLWLHGDPGADASSGVPAPGDVLIPLAPAPPGIAAHRPRTVADLLPALALRLAPAPAAKTTPLLSQPA